MGLMRKGWSQLILGVALLGLALVGLGCKDIVEAPTALTYATNPAVYLAGTAITANAPAHTGGTVDSYAVSPTLPAGLALATKTGIISGTPTAVTALATYTVTATNSAGSTTVSLSITVDGPPLSITTQPASQSIAVGATATFTVVASGTGTLTYQWFLDDIAIPEATSASYTTAAAVVADSGAAYTVQVSDAFGGSVTSSAATLTVRAPLAITTQPTSQSIFVGGTATFNVVASGTGTLTYQWRRNGTAITGATSASYTTPTAALADSGATFSVVVADTFGGSVTSSDATLTVRNALSITTQPASQTIAAGATATFTVVASGTGTLTYQWRRNGTAITGATSASYTTPVLALTDSGATFSVVVADAFGSSVTSSDATLTVVNALTITTQPASQTVVEGATATFTVAATGTGTLTYQWRRNGTAITGATLASYTTPVATLADTGAVFSVVVGDGIGGSVTSANATLTVRASVAAGLFTFTGSLAGGRYLHSATLLNDGTVLVAGGYLTSPVSTLEIYDPSAGTFSSAGVLATPRYGHTATLLADGTVLIAGGITFGAAPTDTVEIYDPATGNLAVAPSLTHARAYHTATRLANGQVLIAAGRDSLAVLQTAELYDHVGLASVVTTGAPKAFRYLHTATLLANGKVLLAGGYGASLLATAELYDPATGTFALTGSMSTGRYWHTATALGNGKVLLTGGSTALAVDLYDPGTGTFSAGGNLSSIRFSHTATLLPSGAVLLAAGKNADPSASGTLLNSAELFDPTTGLLISAGSMGQGRYNHTATLVDGKVLLVGGVGPTFSTAELYF